MSVIKTFFSLIKTPGKMLEPFAKRRLLDWMPDKTYLKLVYRSRLGKELDLDNPETFNEKIQWLKVHDHNPEYIKLVDKIQAKEEVRNIVGDDYIVPLLKTWDKAEALSKKDIHGKCVLKCNHDQGSTIIVDQDSNIADIIIHFKKCLKKNQYYKTREWPYKYIKPKILCEPYLADDIIDYKIFCFDGKAAMINIGQMDHINHIMHISFLDLNWNPMSFQRKDFPPVVDIPPRPRKLEEMIQIAERISNGYSFVRVDLFLVNDRIYFSEFTLYPTSGYIQFDPETGDKYLGRKLNLKSKIWT